MSADITLFHDSVWNYIGGKVYKCGHCELLFIHPMMNDEEELAFYKNYNAHVLARGVTATATALELHNASLSAARERLAIVSKFIKEGSKVLEIGSATGAFLSLLTHCETHACELNDENRSFSTQFLTGSSYPDVASVDSGGFDVICLFHVFEHIRRPQDFLGRCKELLSAAGVLIIEVPCADDPLISLYDCEAFKDFVFQPMHPMVYSETSLDYVFLNAGYRKTEVIYHQRYGLANHLAWFKNKRPGGDAYLEGLFSGWDHYKDVLRDVRKTDTIYYIAKSMN
ncbi:MAG: class I SAM-dependent methyltransferase [Methylomonas sp.]|nr:class I SAM-dependent methyltransferase [Methylomonas sp.]